MVSETMPTCTSNTEPTSCALIKFKCQGTTHSPFATSVPPASPPSSGSFGGWVLTLEVVGCTASVAQLAEHWAQQLVSISEN